RQYQLKLATMIRLISFLLLVAVCLVLFDESLAWGRRRRPNGNSDGEKCERAFPSHSLGRCRYLCRGWPLRKQNEDDGTPCCRGWWCEEGHCVNGRCVRGKATTTTAQPGPGPSTETPGPESTSSQPTPTTTSVEPPSVSTSTEPQPTSAEPQPTSAEPQPTSAEPQPTSAEPQPTEAEPGPTTES
ncbi:SH3 and multiple ankyrin repeat domains protein 1, partial [Ixodes scapularis]|uniref:SH3 and multiple ankyrin repeat domains protein 1 n=1 Tax=Ixodes scapularis TaxID=6945 RepID=UPI001A9D3BD4